MYTGRKGNITLRPNKNKEKTCSIRSRSHTPKNSPLYTLNSPFHVLYSAYTLNSPFCGLYVQCVHSELSTLCTVYSVCTVCTLCSPLARPAGPAGEGGALRLGRGPHGPAVDVPAQRRRRPHPSLQGTVQRHRSAMSGPVYHSQIAQIIIVLGL